MSSHRIRLAGPWEWRPLTETNGVAATGEVQKCQLPFPSEPNFVAGHGVALRRCFHKPTGLNAETTVTVIVEIQEAVPKLWLNDRLLTGIEDSEPSKGESGAISKLWRFDVSGILKSYNVLQVRLIPLRPEAPPRLQAAALEIREA